MPGPYRPRPMTGVLYFDRGVNAQPILATTQDLHEAFEGVHDRRPPAGFRALVGGEPCWISTECGPSGEVRAFTVHQVREDQALWRVLHRLLERYHYCAYWWMPPAPALAGRDDVVPDPELMEDRGPLRIVSDAEELRRVVAGPREGADG